MCSAFGVTSAAMLQAGHGVCFAPIRIDVVAVLPRSFACKTASLGRAFRLRMRIGRAGLVALRTMLHALMKVRFTSVVRIVVAISARTGATQTANAGYANRIISPRADLAARSAMLGVGR